MINLGRILVPTDFSDCSQEAANYACELASRFGAEIHILHVLEPPTRAMPSPGAPLPEQLLADVREQAEKQLDLWLSNFSSQPEKVTQSVRRGTPFVEIVRCAKENDTDLIVIATHGYSGLSHALMGSVAEKVVRKAPCPVLAVREKGHQFVMP